ncbi:MAG: Gfo/Idh/MocA family protein [Bacteroidales bacterium]
MSLNAGVIGCGNISRFHFAGINAAKGKVTAVCDINEEAADAKAKEFNCRSTKDWREITSAPDIDVVHITLISSLHKEICLDAIEQGKAIICEKTLTENPEDSAEVVQAARKKGALLYTSYMKRYIPAVEKAKELLPSIGRIISARFHTYQPWGNNWEGEAAAEFFIKPKEGMSPVRKAYGGGILICGGSHILDLIGFFFGRPDKLYASQFTPPYMDLDLRSEAVLHFGEVTVHFQSLAHPLNHISFLNDGWDEGFTILGSQGKLDFFSSEWDEVEKKAPLLRYYDNRTGEMREFRYSPESPFSLAISSFYRQITKGKQGNQSEATGYDVDYLIHIIQESANTGRAVELNWKI